MKTLLLFFGLLLVMRVSAAELEKWALMQRAVLVEHDLDKIRALVAQGVDPNAPIGCGTYAPLNGAIQQDNLEMVTVLLSLGAKPTDSQMVQAVGANTPVALKMVRMLLEAGGSINARNHYSKADDRFTNPIHRAVWKGDRELIAYLLAQKGIELDNPDMDGYTPLMTAVAKGDPTVVDMLLVAGADPRVKNKVGLDAAGVATQVIERQRSFLKKLARVPDAPMPPPGAFKAAVRSGP